MSNKTASPNHLPAANRWRLWIDGCGGFLLLVSDRVSIGRGPVLDSTVDVGIQADWPRIAGTIQRRSDDYFWSDATDDSSQPSLLGNGQSLPVAAPAKVIFELTSPLSRTAILKVSPPHRLDRHVDAVVLVSRELLIGPSRDCHIRHRELSETVVLVYHADVWRGKVGMAGEFVDLEVGQRMLLGSCQMTMEAA